MARSATVRVAIVSDNSDLARGLKDSEGRLKGFGKSVVKVGVAAGLAAGAGLAIFGKAAVEAASAAEQSLGATETVFGKFAGEVTKTSNRAAQQFGLSADAYRTNANVLGALLTNQGVQQDKLAGKTKNLIGTAADLSATFGGTTADAVEALASAFKGEFDPLEKYGISIKAAAISTEAMAVAGVKTAAEFKKLSKAQQDSAKQTALNNMLMGQSKKTVGAFAKESDTLAHQQQVLGARFTNLKTRIGSALLPVVTDLFKVLNQDLMPTLNRLATRYLPPVAKALRQWVKSGGAADLIGDLGSALEGVSWSKISTDVGDLGDAWEDLGPQLKSISAEQVGDAISVFAVAVGFAADHVDLLAKAMPFLVTGFVAFKSAQLLNNIAGRDSVFGLVAQVYQTRQLKAATDQLASSMTKAGVAITAEGTAAANAATKTSKLGTAAKGAAGIAGLGLMAASASSSSKEIGILGGVAGGALTGFAVGGPWGAALGAGAGLLTGLLAPSEDATAATKALGDQAHISASQMDGYKGSLDSATGAVTSLSRVEALKLLQDTKMLPVGKALGLTARDLVDASVGQAAGLVKVTQARAAEQRAMEANRAEAQRIAHDIAANDFVATDAQKNRLKALFDERQAQKSNIAAIDELIGKTAKARAERRKEIAATADYGKALDRLPSRLSTRIEQKGLPTSIKGVAKLTRQYKLTPKQIRTVLKLMDFKTGERNIKRVQDEVKNLSRAKPDLSSATREIQTYSHQARRDAAQAGDNIGKGLKEGTRKAKADLAPFKRSVRTGTTQAKETASAGAKGVGTSLKSGVLLGLFGLGPALASQMAAAVRQGIHAARAAADAHSPSKETERLGKDLTQGLINGVQRGSDGVAAALEQVTQLVTQTLARGLKDRTNALNAHFAAQRKAIQNSLKGKPEAKALAALKARQAAALKALEAGWKDHTRKVRNHLRGEIKDLREIGRQQDALASGNFIPYLEKTSKLYGQMTAAGVHNLEEARDRLAELTEQAASYAANIKDVFVAFGDVTQLGINEETGAVSFTDMMAQLADRAKAAQDFAALIQRFAGLGLSQTVIDQLIAAGPEAGLATAQAIATGIDQNGQAAIDQINALTGQIAAAGDQTGAVLSTKFYDAGIKAAEGLVSGLESKAEQLDKIARGMAKALIKALKEELGIKSPSAVMAGIGGQISQGLAIGVNDTHARTAGQSLAAALVSGFGTPGLSASLTPGSLNGPGPQRIDVTLRAPQINELERGRSIQIALDTYHAAGGRAQARG